MANKRIKKQSKHKTLKLSKHPKNKNKALPGVLKLFGSSIRLFLDNKRLFIGIAAIYFVLSLILVQGLSSAFSFAETRNNVIELLGTDAGQVTSSLTLFGFLMGSSGQAGETAGLYQVFLTLVTSLAIIWGIRQLMAGKKIRIRDTFYRGMYPLIPFILVLLVIALQFLPALIGNVVYSLVVQNGLAITTAEKAFWLVLFLLTLLLSAYMILSSLFALYIVTLSDMTPMKALRSARDLVINRRLAIGLRLICLPIVLVLAAMIVMIPIISLLPAIALPAFLFLGGLGLYFTHSYIYILYRELL